MNNMHEPMEADNYNYCKSAVYPSGSKSSPGPIQRFRDNYAHEYVRANFGERVVSWMHNGPIGAQNSYHYASRPSSVMSRTSISSIATNASQLSVMTDFSDMTAMSTMYTPMVSVCSENISTNNMEEIDVEELINKLCKPNSNQEWFGILQKIKDYIRNPAFPVKNAYFNLIIEQIFIKLNNLTNSADNSELICNCFDTIYNLVNRNKDCKNFYVQYSSAKRSEFIVHLLCSYLYPEKIYIKYVLSLIRDLTMRKKPDFNKYFRKYPNIVDILLRIIQTENKSSLRYALKILSDICWRQSDVKREFTQKGGIIYILNFLQKENDEKMLFAFAEFLSKLFEYLKDDEIILSFIKSNGLQICAAHLDHGSPRLLHYLLDCLVYSADQLKNFNNLQLNDCIRSVFKLLGSMDYKLVLNAIKFLGNSMAIDRKNKLLFIELQAPNTLMRVIEEALAHQPDIIMEDLVENALWAIGLLLNNYPAKEDKSLIAIGQLTSYPTWREILLYVLEKQPTVAIKRAAIILNSIAVKQFHLIESYREVNNGYRLGDVVYQKIIDNFLIINGTKVAGPPNYHRLKLDYAGEVQKELGILNGKLLMLMFYMAGTLWSPECIYRLMNIYGNVFNFIELTLYSSESCVALLRLAYKIVHLNSNFKQELVRNSAFCLVFKQCLNSKDKEILDAAKELNNC